MLAGIFLARVFPLSAVGAQEAEAFIQWVKISGGSFMMGSGFGDAVPVHRVRVKSFEMAKSEVTFKQYEACVKAGACSPVSDSKFPDF
jgi:formylglycine-generating enzyme required for sulfatase activity